MGRCIDMRTNVVLDDRLVSEALRLSKLRTKKSLIHKALEEFVTNHSRLDLREIRGQIEFSEDYDYKATREP